MAVPMVSDLLQLANLRVVEDEVGPLLGNEILDQETEMTKRPASGTDGPSTFERSSGIGTPGSN